MQIFNLIWLITNILTILLIFIRNPNAQSLEETLSPLNLFESSSSGAKLLDRLIPILAASYFIIGFLLTTKLFI